MVRHLLFLIPLVVLSTNVSATTINVPADQPTIQAGINAAAAGDVVLVAEGNYYENINFIGKTITVASHFLTDGDTTHINNTVIDGSKTTNPDSGSVVYFISSEDTASVLQGFTISGGRGTETNFWFDGNQYFCRAGGGIFCYNSGARIVNNKIINNAVASPEKKVLGGGIAALPFENTDYVVIRDNRIMHNTITAKTDFAWGGSVVLLCNGILSNNQISYNSVIHNATTTQASTGGLECWSLSSDRRTVIIETNKITHNSVVSYSDNVPAALGGGVSIKGSQGRFTKNEVSHNEIWVKADQYGCGAGMQLLELPDSFILEGNIISENTVTQGNGYGGGLNIHTNSSPTLANNIVSKNSANNGGAFLISGNSAPKLINNIVINNNATSGGGIYLGGSSNVYLMNTIMWGNHATTHTTIHIESGTVQAAYCDIQSGWSGTGNIKTDPQLAADSYQLSDASPCIGKGAAFHDFGGGVVLQAPAADFFGHPRPAPVGSHPDIGAVEHERAFPKRQHLVEVPNDQFTIQAGIDAAVNGDTVLVAEGTYYENINFKGKAITVAGHFLMDDDTTHINNTIINGSQPIDPKKGSVVSFVSGEDTTSVLCGLTITGGSGTEAAFIVEGEQVSIKGGGGIFCYNSGARIVNNKIVENRVNSPDRVVEGGGLAALPFGSTAFVILQDNQISHNTLTADLQYALGGGVELESNGRLENNVISFNSIVHNATTGQAGSGGVDCYSSPSDRRQAVVICNKITRNSVFSKSNLVGTSAFGGGISYYGSYGRFADNEISYNELRANSDKSAGGAGILINEAPDSLIMDGNSIFKNEVKQGNGLGGGVLIGKNSSLTVTNNIIEGNSATVGGGFIIARSTVHLVNNTVINNQATDGGGGINVRMSSTVYLMNTILWGNQAATYAGIQREEGTVKAAYCDIQGGWSGEGNINADPLFTDDSYHLASSSPCVGAGIHAYDFGEGMICTCPSTDYNGDPRPYPVDAHVDMGAIESEYLIDDVQEKTEQIPTHFALEQNYPNPFNPSTTIEFTLPKSDFVTLTVYNLCGEQVTTLITERMEAGVHCFKWNGSSLANGMYLYRLEAGEFSQSKKLVLLR